MSHSDAFNLLDNSSAGNYTTTELLDVYARLSAQNQIIPNSQSAIEEHVYKSSTPATPLLTEMNQHQTSLLSRMGDTSSFLSNSGTPNISATSLAASRSGFMNTNAGGTGGQTGVDSLLLPSTTGISTTATVGTDQFSMGGMSRSVSQIPQSMVIPDLASSFSAKWYYKDRQQEIRGPYDNSTMQGWYSAGFFPPDLSIKTEDTEDWLTIQDLVQVTNALTPFVPGQSSSNSVGGFFGQGTYGGHHQLLNQMASLNMTSNNSNIPTTENSPTVSNVSILQNGSFTNFQQSNGIFQSNASTPFFSNPHSANNNTFGLDAFSNKQGLTGFGVDDDLSSRVNSVAASITAVPLTPSPTANELIGTENELAKSKPKEQELSPEKEKHEIINPTKVPIPARATVTESKIIQKDSDTSAPIDPDQLYTEKPEDLKIKKSRKKGLESIVTTATPSSVKDRIPLKEAFIEKKQMSPSSAASSVAPWATVTKQKQRLPSKSLEDIQREEQLKRQEQRKLEEKDRLLASRLALQDSDVSLNVFTKGKKAVLDLSVPSTKASTPTLPTTSTWATLNKPVKVAKSLEEIQREELEAARIRAAQQQQMDILASHKQSFADTLASDNSWTIVDKKQKPKTESLAPAVKPPNVTPSLLRSVSSSLAPTKPSTSYKTPTSAVATATVPSHAQKFLLWARGQMTGLYASVKMEELLNIILQLGTDSDAQEIIADTIYSNSSTMDGRRFATEFIKKRKEVDALVRSRGWTFDWAVAVKSTSGKKEVVEDEWESFVTVTKKGKKSKN